MSHDRRCAIARPARHQHDPDAGDRRRPEGELRAPGRAHGRRTDGVHALDKVPPPCADAPRLARSRPLRPFGRARLDAPLLAPSSDRLRRVARRPQVVPSMGLEDPGPSRVRADAGRRGVDRAARPGLHECRRHGDRRASAGLRVQPARPRHHRPLDLHALLRRRPPGGDRVRGGRRSRGTSGSASSLPSTTTTASSSMGRRRWPGPRMSSPGSPPIRGTPSASRTATTSRRSRGRSRPPARTRGRRSSPSRPTSASAARTARTRRRHTASRSAPTRSGSSRRPTAGIRTATSTSPTRRPRSSARRSRPARRSSRPGRRSFRHMAATSRTSPRSSAADSPASSPTAGTRASRPTPSARRSRPATRARRRSRRSPARSRSCSGARRTCPSRT